MYSVIKLLILAFIAGAFALGAISLFKHSRNMTRSDFKDNLRRSVFFRINVLVLAIVLSCVFSFVGFLGAKQSATAKISLSYDEASQGRNANGTRYNMSEIICDEVIKKAIDMGALEGVSVKDLKSCLSVSALVQGSSNDKSSYHISTEFLISYTANRKTSKYDAETVVQLVANSYREYYFDKYVSNFVIDFDEMKEEVKDLDYMKAADYLDKNTNIILNYLYGLQYKNNSFVSSEGLTFSSVIERVHKVSSVQIHDNLIPYILQNGISKEPVRYSNSLNYVNLMLGFDRDRASVSYRVTNNAILKYAEEMTRVVLVPTWDEDGKYYMGRTKVGIDELSVQAMDYSDDNVGYEEEIQKNNLILSKMAVPGANSQTVKDNADKIIQNVMTDIEKYAVEAHRIGQEYYANQMNKCISINISGASLFGQLKSALLIFIMSYCAFMLYSVAKQFSEDEQIGEDDGR